MKIVKKKTTTAKKAVKERHITLAEERRILEAKYALVNDINAIAKKLTDKKQIAKLKSISKKLAAIKTDI